MAALVLVLSALAGFQHELRSEILERTPHLEVEASPDVDPEALLERIAGIDGVVEAQLVVRGRGWIVFRGLGKPVEVIGFQDRLPRSFPGHGSRAEGLYVSVGLASSWGLSPGDLVDIVSPRPTLTPMGPQPRVRSVPIAGTFDSGKVDEIERVAIPLDVGRSLFGERETRIEVAAAGLDQALALVAPVREVAAGGAVRTWKELNRPLFFALGLEKTLMFVAVGLVLVVAALALVADLALVIATKRRELAMLAALGATPLDLRRALVTLGGALTTLGVSGGLVVGLGGAWILDHYRLLALPRQVYFLDYVPFRPELWDVVGVVGLTALLAGLSTGFAVRRVASRARFQVIRP